VYNL